MKKKSVLTILIGVLVLAAGAASVTVTAENEYKLIRQFGKVKRVISAPGISLKVPFLKARPLCRSRLFCMICLRLM